MKVEDLFKIRKGKKANSEVDDYQDGAIRYIQIEDLRNDNNIKYCINDDDSIIAKENDIIIAWDGANAATSNYNLNGAIGSTLARLRPKRDDFSLPYVGLFIKNKQQYLRDKCTGATIPHVDRQVLQNLEVPLPDYDVQERIVKLIENVDVLRKKRHQTIEKLDELTQSVFLDMFGDPVLNKRDWPIVKLSELGSLNRGKSRHRPRNAPKLLGGPYPLIQTGDVSNSGGYITEYKSTYSELGLKQSKMWEKGTLCITIAANIANTGILTFDACFPDSVVGFKPNKKSNVEYVQGIFYFLQKILEETAPQVAQKNINLTILRNLEVPAPTMGLQDEYAKRIDLILEQKKRAKKQLDKLDNLFNSLLQKAFKGDLFENEEVELMTQ